MFERAVISKEIAEKGRAERIKRTENLQDIVAKEMSLTGDVIIIGEIKANGW